MGWLFTLSVVAVVDRLWFGHAFSSVSPSWSRLAAPHGRSVQLTSAVGEGLLMEQPTISTSAASSRSFKDFDYKAHWYPVIWACDLQLNQPTKVTVFDVDYVVAKTSETEVICLQDRCPHKAAALSQGRVTETGNFQCAYHGWSFNGKTGECVDIPQITQAKAQEGSNGLAAALPKIPSQSCGHAVPAQIHQEMVWIFPGGNLEDALLATPPPSVVEYDEGFEMTTSIRDFPVDWPILVSNICDPDHGLFAHQAKPFDMYTASKEFPMTTDEEYTNSGKGWILKSKVDSISKMLKVDETWRGDGKKKSKKKVAEHETPWATSTLHVPFHLQLKRVDKDTNKSKFVSAFYICPVGVGRSRFMAASVSKTSTKRWLSKLFLDNFLDQDTYLLATQQKYILDQEARDVKEMIAQQEKSPMPMDISQNAMTTRRNLFCLCSPTEKFGSRLEQFWDATLLRSPNRIERLLQMHSAGAFSSTPSREFVLDRKTQNLDICRDAQDTERNCRRVSFAAKWFGISALAARAFASLSNKRVFLLPSSAPGMAALCGLSFLVSWAAEKMRKEYYFKYTDDMRQKDLSKIPQQIWMDKLRPTCTFP